MEKNGRFPRKSWLHDDVIFLKSGDQVPADAVVLEGSVEVNESLLTGEADNLVKTVKDELFSGSFVTAGEACCQVIHVGKDNYASQITKEAKEFKKHNSELRNALNKILKVISIIILPLGIMLFYKQFYMVGDSFKNSVGKHSGGCAWNDSRRASTAYQCGSDFGSAFSCKTQNLGSRIVLY